ncbi:DEAD/DEAH box helicase family protein [uncultured Tenacibaculum sp.]|uniref:DEAD/DEAH box helicase n=1 Tax=uncultured Tenacibaculum sp. TaxID=174713 RepID=UPI002633BC38|nr:DEAD/DEAH box helicase family protein [uncultured Tenacibaculum sp.]
MIDFKKRIKKVKEEKELNPIKIYDSLDRSSDKGPLRPSQEQVLNKWYSVNRNNKDCVLKLHTGQGKTIVGLLILQSKLNETNLPSLYVCPNIYLVNQTCIQADQFGIDYCIIEPDGNIPEDFINGKKILITHSQKVFNGFTKFGFKGKALQVGAIILDDSHSCIDTIENSFTIKIKFNTELYNSILGIFESSIEKQGYARLQEVKEGKSTEVLSVPYWDWNEYYKDVIELLSENKRNEDYDYIFAWNLIKDNLENCYCTFSSGLLEIKPYHNPIDQYGSFFNAKHRVFMSATTNNDSFFIKGLGLSKDTITNPIIYDDELWSGEKMILLPYKIDNQLNRVGIINHFAPQNELRKYGVVALTSGFNKSNLWEELGASTVKRENIKEKIGALKGGDYKKTIVITNRYDGIDLPDNNCRILIIDSKPYSQNLHEKYQEDVRQDSDLIDIKIAQKIEQGLGRGVRGEKDYCVIILTGNDILQVISNPRYKRFFSQETQKQLEIGVNVTSFAIEDADTSDGIKVLTKTIDQCLDRNSGWKEYYKSEMDSITKSIKVDNILEILEKEREAEEIFSMGKNEEAIQITQNIIDTFIHPDNKTEHGWYLQQMGRFINPLSVSRSNEYQILAHQKNKYLYKPNQGMSFQKLKIHENRNQKILDWVSKFDKQEDLLLRIDVILNNLSFGVKADTFEHALEELGEIIGFNSERPEKYWKKGPDNLWCVDNGKYILFECKNCVKENRAEIYKKETGQMSNSYNWFKRKYKHSNCIPIMIINTKNVAKEASLDTDVMIMKKNKLRVLKNNVRNFFKEFLHSKTEVISIEKIAQFLKVHKLTVDDISNLYVNEPYHKK